DEWDRLAVGDEPAERFPQLAPAEQMLDGAVADVFEAFELDRRQTREMLGMDDILLPIRPVEQDAWDLGIGGLEPDSQILQPARVDLCADRLGEEPVERQR